MSNTKYTSLFGSEKQLTGAQYLAEVMCKKMATIKNVYLPPLFWTKDEWIDWKKKIHIENIAANKLLKLYSVEAIIEALKDKRASYVQSFHNKNLPRIIQEKEREINNRNRIRESEKPMKVVLDVTSLPTKLIGKTNRLNRLRD